MLALTWLRYGSAACACGLVLSYASTVLADDAVSSGRQLFEHEWSYKDSLSGHGDGVGPVFNARSCAACHHQQGTGGGGDNTHNVDLLTLVDFKSGGRDDAHRSRDESLIQVSRKPLERLHPGFRTANSITLHAAGDEKDYKNYRLSLLGQGPASVRPYDGDTSPISVKLVSRAGRDNLEWDKFVLQQSQRQTPSLFGAGEIDRISDQALQVLRAEAQKNASSSDSRRRFKGTPTARRFGWKGQTSTLREFVAGACANELGLQTRGIPQPLDPTQPGYRHDRVDMTEQKLNELVEFVASLPPPRRLEPANELEAEGLARGAALFSKAKCQTCHVPDIDQARGIYSDLQLHNMGKSLSDPTGPALTRLPPRPPTTLPVSTSSAADDPDLVGEGASSSTSEAYYGPTVEQLAALWKTPPLWGVRDTAPYMHDGRAASLDEAIKMHGGEAAPSADRYRDMTQQERRDLRTFVYSLGAP